MCIAVLTKPGAIVPNDQLWEGWSRNRDGGGFAYVKDDKVVIEKGFMEYNKFQKAYAKAAEKYAEDSPFLVHMRVRTSGATDAANTHPFKIKGGAMIHNGVMFYPTSTQHKGKSDTRIFAERFHNILVLEDVLKAEEEILFAVGPSNKLVFLYDDKRYAILGEDQGYWENDIWYSNTSCRIPASRINSSKLPVVKKD